MKTHDQVQSDGFEVLITESTARWDDFCERLRKRSRILQLKLSLLELKHSLLEFAVAVGLAVIILGLPTLLLLVFLPSFKINLLVGLAGALFYIMLIFVWLFFWSVALDGWLGRLDPAIRRRAHYFGRLAEGLNRRQRHCATKNLLRHHRLRIPYGLYLRVFSDEQFSEWEGPEGVENAPPKEFRPVERQTDEAIVRRISEYIPLFSLGNIDDAIPPRRLQSLYVANEDWISVSYALISNARVVVIVALSTTSPGLETEASFIQDKGFQEKTLVVTGTDEAQTWFAEHGFIRCLRIGVQGDKLLSDLASYTKLDEWIVELLGSTNAERSRKSARVRERFRTIFAMIVIIVLVVLLLWLTLSALQLGSTTPVA